MGRRGIFVAIFLISCAPNQIYCLSSSCNDQTEPLLHSDTQSTLEEQSAYNNFPEIPEDDTQSTIVSKPQFEILPSNNFNRYNRLFLLPRKFLFEKMQDKLHGNLWPNEVHQTQDKEKRSEKGMLLDAPEYILNPNSGGNGNGGRRVGGLMKSSG